MNNKNIQVFNNEFELVLNLLGPILADFGLYSGGWGGNGISQCAKWHSHRASMALAGWLFGWLAALLRGWLAGWLATTDLARRKGVVVKEAKSQLHHCCRHTTLHRCVSLR